MAGLGSSRAAALWIAIGAAACSGRVQTDGARGGASGAATSAAGGAAASAAGGSTAGGSAAGARAVGSPCVDDSESVPSYPGSSLNEVVLGTEDPDCSSRICLGNHFRGRASCPYGQAAGDGGCFLPGSSIPVAVAVAPQDQQRQAAIASVCSCRCAGSGPGPYCTCPADMACVDLVPDLGFGGGPDALAGSYCIPAGSEYDSSLVAVDCVPPNCGPARPY